MPSTPIFTAFLIIELNQDTYLGLGNLSHLSTQPSRDLYPVITHAFSPDLMPSTPPPPSDPSPSSDSSAPTNPSQPTFKAFNVQAPISTHPKASATPTVSSPSSGITTTGVIVQQQYQPPFPNKLITAIDVIESLPKHITKLAYPDYHIVNSGFASSHDAVEYTFTIPNQDKLSTLLFGYCRRFTPIDQDMRFPIVHCFISQFNLPKHFSQCLEITQIRHTISKNALFAFLHSFGSICTDNLLEVVPKDPLVELNFTVDPNNAHNRTLQYIDRLYGPNPQTIKQRQDQLQSQPDPQSTTSPINPSSTSAPKLQLPTTNKFKREEEEKRFQQKCAQEEEIRLKLRTQAQKDFDFISIVYQRHLPYPANVHKYTFPIHQHSLYIPDERSPSLSLLLQTLSVDNVIKLYSILFQERVRVLFIASASQINTLMQVVIASSLLLQPFSWQGLCIPLLPHSLAAYYANLQSIPWIFGTTKQSLEHILKSPLHDVVLVDLDRDQIIVRQSDTSSNTSRPLDQALQSPPSSTSALPQTTQPTLQQDQFPPQPPTSPLPPTPLQSNQTGVTIPPLLRDKLERELKRIKSKETKMSNFEISQSISIAFQAVWFSLLSTIHWDRIFSQEHLHVLNKALSAENVALVSVDPKVSELTQLIHIMVGTTYFREFVCSRSPFKNLTGSPASALPEAKLPPLDKVTSELFEAKLWPIVLSYTGTCKKLQSHFTSMLQPEQSALALSNYTKALTMTLTANDSDPCFPPESIPPLLLNPDLGLCTAERYRTHTHKSIYDFIVDCTDLRTDETSVPAPATRFMSPLQLLKDRAAIIDKVQSLLTLSYDTRYLDIVFEVLERRFEDRLSQRQWKHPMHSLLVLDAFLQSGAEYILTRPSKKLKQILEDLILYVHKERNIEIMVRWAAMRVKQIFTTLWALCGTRVYREGIPSLFFQVLDPQLIPHLDRLSKQAKFKNHVVLSPTGPAFPWPLTSLEHYPYNLSVAHFSVDEFDQNARPTLTTNTTQSNSTRFKVSSPVNQGQSELTTAFNKKHTKESSNPSEPFPFNQFYDTTLSKQPQYVSSSHQIFGTTTNKPSSNQQTKEHPQLANFSVIPQFSELQSMFLAPFSISSVTHNYISTVASETGYSYRNFTKVTPLYICYSNPQSHSLPSDHSSLYSDSTLQTTPSLTSSIPLPPTSSSSSDHIDALSTSPSDVDKEPILRFYVTQVTSNELAHIHNDPSLPLSPSTRPLFTSPSISPAYPPVHNNVNNGLMLLPYQGNQEIFDLLQQEPEYPLNNAVQITHTSIFSDDNDTPGSTTAATTSTTNSSPAYQTPKVKPTSQVLNDIEQAFTPILQKTQDPLTQAIMSPTTQQQKISALMLSPAVKAIVNQDETVQQPIYVPELPCALPLLVQPEAVVPFVSFSHPLSSWQSPLIATAPSITQTLSMNTTDSINETARESQSSHSSEQAPAAVAVAVDSKPKFGLNVFKEQFNSLLPTKNPQPLASSGTVMHNPASETPSSIEVVEVGHVDVSGREVRTESLIPPPPPLDNDEEPIAPPPPPPEEQDGVVDFNPVNSLDRKESIVVETVDDWDNFPLFTRDRQRAGVTTHVAPQSPTE